MTCCASWATSGWYLGPNTASLIPKRPPLSKKAPEELAKIQAEHPGKQVVTFFQNECRFSQQGTLTRVWAKRGSRPTAVRQTEYEYLWVIGAASPQSGHVAVCSGKLTADWREENEDCGFTRLNSG